MRTAIYDLENTVFKTGDIKGASPWNEKDFIVMGEAHVVQNGVPQGGTVSTEPDQNSTLDMLLRCQQIVGFNIHHDLTWLASASNSNRQAILAWLHHPQSILWDCQLAHYLMHGQQVWPSLSSVAEHYDIGQKGDVIKDAIADKQDIDEIDKKILGVYLRQDVLLTKEIWELQTKYIPDDFMLFFVENMRSLMSTIIMHINGMYINTNSLENYKLYLEGEQGSIIKYLYDIDYNVNWSSPQQVGTVFFGGEILIDGEEQVLNDDGSPYRYKSGLRKGQIKTRKVKISLDYPEANQTLAARTSSGQYRIDDEILRRLVHSADNNVYAKIAEKILELRRIQKELGTYAKSIERSMDAYGVLRGKHNHCAAVTGRLTSSNPNMQNISGKEA